MLFKETVEILHGRKATTVGYLSDAEVYVAQLFHRMGEAEKIDVIHNGGVGSVSKELAKIALVNGHRPADLAEVNLFGEMLIDILDHRNDLIQVPVIGYIAVGEEVLPGEMRHDP